MARFAVAKTNSAVGAAAYLPDGSVTASQFTASLCIARKLGAAPGSASFIKTNQTIQAFNVLDEAIDADVTVLLGQTVDEIWVVHCIY